MEARKLMIGDWVKLTNPKYPDAEQIIGITSSNSIQLSWGEVHTDSIEAIPLTEELLAFNKFNKEFGVYHYPNLKNKNKIMIQFYNDEYASFSFYNAKKDMYIIDNAEFVYVHELQHLLRICNLDDLADLFSVI